MPVMEDMLATPAVNAKDMPFVSFYTETIEDVKETKATGKMKYKDQDFALITPPGGKMNNKERIETFFSKMENDMKAGRVHPDWIRVWKANYKLYQEGQQIPVDGTPIKGWKLLPGAVQEQLISLNIRTVEELANLNDEGIKNVGMGAREWQRRAKAWQLQNETHETGALKMTELTRQNETLAGTVASLTDKIAELEKALAKRK